MQNTNSFTRWYRIGLIVIHTLVGLSIAATVFPFCENRTRLGLTRWWCRRLLRCFNIRVQVYGDPPQEHITSNMLIANHISWIDIHAINSVIPVRFIAKVEIKSWPVFGYLVSKSGTLFINRSMRKDAARIVEITSESLHQGDNVCFFPEGTTTDGTYILPFKSSIMQAAINANAFIRPVTIFYPNPDGSANIVMAYAGETTLIESMRAVLGLKSPVVELHFHQAISTLNESRQSITAYAHHEISQCFKKRSRPD